MEHYINFDQNKFLNYFAKCIDVKQLINSAVPLSQEQIYRCGNKYEKECCLDFSGISALLYGEKNKYLENIVKFKSEFEKNKIRLHFRFLLVYPYSAHAVARMQAEMSQNRATIKVPIFKQQGIVESVNIKLFHTSNFVKEQNEFLKYLGKFMIEDNISENTEHRLIIRFTPTAVNVCMYRINDIMFISPYLLAKDWPTDSKSVLRSPIIKFSRSENRETFEAFIDHFRYLWNLPQCIFLEDITNFENGKPIDITEIKAPHNVDFKIKSNKLKAKGVHGDSSSWKRQVKDLLYRLCPVIPENLQTKESIFIACSWKKKNEYLSSDPNTIAIKIKKWLDEDIGKSVDIRIVETNPGELIEKEIYTNLNSSTVGIILFTCDIKGDDDTYYSRPNIYHELGYLMAKYKAQGYDTKVIPIFQSLNGTRVVPPSNISNVSWIDLNDDMVEAIYEKLLISVQRLLSLDVSIICHSLSSHKKRINDLVINGDLNSAKSKSWCKEIDERIKKLSCKECDKSNCEIRRLAYVK